MNTQLLTVAGAMLLIGGLLGYNIARDTGFVRESDEGRTRTESVQQIPWGMHMMDDGTMMGNETNQGMGMMGGSGMMGMTVRSEEEFLREMIPHHEEAVRTATEVLERGSDNVAVQALAQNIITAQTSEIKQMRSWYKSWYGKDYTPDGSYQPMMRDLSKLSGTTLDEAFLEDMIRHHMGALMMAKSVIPYSTHQEIKTLTENIITSQTKQIAEMKVLLTQ
jgi:uncharacterized protein (DUF305 family)